MKTILRKLQHLNIEIRVCPKNVGVHFLIWLISNPLTKGGRVFYTSASHQMAIKTRCGAVISESLLWVRTCRALWILCRGYLVPSVDWKACLISVMYVSCCECLMWLSCSATERKSAGTSAGFISSTVLQGADRGCHRRCVDVEDANRVLGSWWGFNGEEKGLKHLQ